MLTKLHHSGEDADENCSDEEIGTHSQCHKMRFNEHHSTFTVDSNSEAGPASYFAKRCLKRIAVESDESKSQRLRYSSEGQKTCESCEVSLLYFNLRNGCCPEVGGRSWISGENKIPLFGEGQISSTRA